MVGFEHSFLNDWMKIVDIFYPIFAGCGVYLKNIALYKERCCLQMIKS